MHLKKKTCHFFTGGRLVGKLFCFTKNHNFCITQILKTEKEKKYKTKTKIKNKEVNKK
jgi:hypothetical protein